MIIKRITFTNGKQTSTDYFEYTSVIDLIHEHYADYSYVKKYKCEIIDDFILKIVDDNGNKISYVYSEILVNKVD